MSETSAAASSGIDVTDTAPPATSSSVPRALISRPRSGRGLRPLRELEAQITELAGHLNAASHRWLMLIAEFDRREGWADGSTTSCAHWLGWKCGIDRGRWKACR